MVSGVLPGELVEVRLQKWKSKENIIEAELISVLEPSTYRIQPVCKYFQECSGCQLQHADISFQREWKRIVVENHLHDQNMSYVSVNPVLGTDMVYGYRSKITPSYIYPAGEKPASIGFFNNKTRRPIDITHCAVASDIVNARYAKYRIELLELNRPENTKKYQMRPLLLRESEKPHNHVEVNQKNLITQTVLGYEFQYCANDFFQINSSLLPMFFQYIMNQAIASYNSKKMKYLIDTYCGCGVFSIILSPHFQQVLGIDISYQSIQSADHNKSRNSITNVTFQHGDANEIFSSASLFPSDETVVIMDPSRKGSDNLFLQQLFQFSPAKIVYVACDVQTQIRDCQLILQNGYKIVDCQPFDMFPQTSHIENVLTMIRR